MWQKQLIQVLDDLFRTIRFVYNFMSRSIAQKEKELKDIYFQFNTLINYFSLRFVNYLVLNNRNCRERRSQ